MTELYDGSELSRESKKKKLWFTIFWIVTGIVIAVSAALFVYFCMQQYEWSGRAGLMWIQIAIVAVYATVSYGFFSLKYRRQKAYCKMLKNLRDGLKEIDTGEVLGVAAEQKVKEGVDFDAILVLQWNENKQNYFERKILVDCEKDIPPVKERDILHFVTQANMLVSWEVLKRPAGEPTLEEKKATMTAKDRELLSDNVILDEEGLKELRRNRRKMKRERMEKARAAEAQANRQQEPFPETQQDEDEEENRK